MTIIDTHQHFWDPSEMDLPKSPPEASILDNAYLPADLEPAISKVGVNYTVLVQGYPQDLDTNRWYFKHANANSFIAGVVAWVDLENPSTLDAQLDDLYLEPKFVGIRHNVEGELNPDWILQDSVVESFKQLAIRKVPYDMLVKPHHLSNVLKLLDKVPELNMVIDHIAKPDIATGTSNNWAADLTTISENTNVYCKLSGMVTEADWAQWTTEDIRPYVDNVLEIFGFDRLMYGSDWPVCLLAANYERVWSSTNDLVQNLDHENYMKIFGGNAIKFYGVKLP